MRYIVDSDGYLLSVSFGAQIECGGVSCTEYTGSVPDGYTSLENWFSKEVETLYRWMIVDGELTMDSDATAPEDYDWKAKVEEALKTFLPLTGGSMTGDVRTTARHYFDTARAETFGAGAGSIVQTISNAADGKATPIFSAVYDGERVYGLDVRNDATNTALRIYAGEDYFELGAWGFKFNDKRLGQTLLWSGTLSSGSATFGDGYTYDRYLVVGRVASGYPLVPVLCPTALLSTTQKWSLSDEAHYINFILTTGSIQISTNSGGGSIVAVYGVN